LGRRGAIHTFDRPSAGPASQRDTIGARANVHTFNLVGRNGEKAFGRGRQLAAQLRPLSRKGQGEKKHRQYGDRERRFPSCSHRCRRRQRRLHHIATPKRAVPSGSKTSSAIKVLRIWSLVSAISGKL